MRQLGLRHLEREQRHRHAGLDGRVLRDVGGRGALAHRRAGGEDDQVAGLEPAGQRVEVREAGGRAGEPDVGLRQLLELVDLVVEDRLQRAHLRRAAVVADLEQDRLGALDQLARLAAVGRDVVLDLARGPQHAPEQRVLLDDARVVEHRAHRRHDRRQRVEVRLAAGLVQLARRGAAPRPPSGRRPPPGWPSPSGGSSPGRSPRGAGGRSRAGAARPRAGRRRAPARSAGSPRGRRPRPPRCGAVRRRRCLGRDGYGHGLTRVYAVGVTIVLMSAVTPSETSTETMCVPVVLIGSSSRTRRLSSRTPRA